MSETLNQQTDANSVQKFSAVKGRIAAAIFLPFIFACFASQALTYHFWHGIDGFMYAVLFLFTLFWLLAFFFCFFAKSAAQAWYVPIIATLIAAALFLF